MDRPRRPEPIEPDDSSGQTPSSDVPAEQPIHDAVDRQPDLGDPRPQEPTDRGDRTVNERSTPPAESSKDTPAPRPNEAQADRPREPSTRPARDAADAVAQQGRRDVSPEATQPSGDSTPALPASADRLPADLRAKMLEHPAFTRLGRGADGHDDSHDDGGTDRGEQVDARNSARDDDPLRTQSTIDKQEPASDGGATRAEDLELSHADEGVVDEPVSTGGLSELPEVRTDAESPNAKLANDADRSGDRMGVSSSTEESLRDEERDPEEDLAIAVAGADDPGVRQDVADDPGEEVFDVVVGGEALGERVGRWDANRINLSRPWPTDSDELDQRSADESSAVAYIAANKEQKPWLAPAAACEPAVQSIYASLDQGSGHAHIRHGPALDQQALARRVARLEDPAQLDDNLREEGVDGLDPTKMHRCGPYATTIVDARTFAAAIAVLSERPDVQDALASDWDGVNPLRLVIPIADVLGEQGHEYCLGVQLAGDPKEAQEERKQWMQAKADGADLSALPEPRVEPIHTFEGGDLFVIFKRNYGTSKFEINTIYPNPARPESE